MKVRNVLQNPRTPQYPDEVFRLICQRCDREFATASIARECLMCRHYAGFGWPIRGDMGGE